MEKKLSLVCYPNFLVQLCSKVLFQFFEIIQKDIRYLQRICRTNFSLGIQTLVDQLGKENGKEQCISIK